MDQPDDNLSGFLKSVPQPRRRADLEGLDARLMAELDRMHRSATLDSFGGEADFPFVPSQAQFPKIYEAMTAAANPEMADWRFKTGIPGLENAQVNSLVLALAVFRKEMNPEIEVPEMDMMLERIEAARARQIQAVDQVAAEEVTPSPAPAAPANAPSVSAEDLGYDFDGPGEEDYHGFIPDDHFDNLSDLMPAAAAHAEMDWPASAAVTSDPENTPVTASPAAPAEPKDHGIVLGVSNAITEKAIDIEDRQVTSADTAAMARIRTAEEVLARAETENAETWNKVSRITKAQMKAMGLFSSIRGEEEKIGEGPDLGYEDVEFRPIDPKTGTPMSKRELDVHGIPPRPTYWPSFMKWPLHDDLVHLKALEGNPAERETYLDFMAQRETVLLQRAKVVDDYLRDANNLQPAGTGEYDRKPPFYGIRWASLLDETSTARTQHRVVSWTHKTLTATDFGQVFEQKGELKFKLANGRSGVSPEAIRLAMIEGKARGWGSFRCSFTAENAKIALQIAQELEMPCEIKLLGNLHPFVKPIKWAPPPPVAKEIMEAYRQELAERKKEHAGLHEDMTEARLMVPRETGPDGKQGKPDARMDRPEGRKGNPDQKKPSRSKDTDYTGTQVRDVFDDPMKRVPEAMAVESDSSPHPIG
ncbi:hypothetical protein ACEUZ9_002820 [Paracoccus litorisediminis]|uniref:hypothetical protein n=1 Tax=Paracoccus litorisediminis TaxID=2006130 RepID=UPI00372EB254